MGLLGGGIALEIQTKVESTYFEYLNSIITLLRSVLSIISHSSEVPPKNILTEKMVWS